MVGNRCASLLEANTLEGAKPKEVFNQATRLILEPAVETLLVC